TFQDPVHEVCGASAYVAETDTIGHQTALLHEIPDPVNPWQPMLEGDLHQLHPVRVGESAERGDDASHTVFLRSREDRIDIIRTLDSLEVHEGDPNLLGSRLQFAPDFGERAHQSGAQDAEP